MTKQPKNKTIAIFEGSKIRRHWDEKKEIWYFAVSDVIAVLTKSVNPTAYWRKLKEICNLYRVFFAELLHKTLLADSTQGAKTFLPASRKTSAIAELTASSEVTIVKSISLALANSKSSEVLEAEISIDVAKPLMYLLPGATNTRSACSLVLKTFANV